MANSLMLTQDQSQGGASRCVGGRPWLNVVVVVMAVLALVVLVKIWIYPEWGIYRAVPLELPAKLRIEGWESAGWHTMELAPEERPKPAFAAEYQYLSNAFAARMEARSYERLAAGIAQHAMKVKGLPETSDLRAMGDVGWYRVQVHDGLAILDVCLDARGRPTATAEQFAANRRAHDRTISRSLSWLFGRGPLHDPRCVWLHVALATGEMTDEQAYRTLEHLLASWQSAWVSRFQ